ncbi:hypothetical protein Tco_0037534, partial [Tanacetum coccineum]
MSTQQDIYAAGSENRPPMLNKENYVPWSSRLLRYAKLRAQLFDKVSDQKDTNKGMSANTKFAKQSILGKPPSSSRPKPYAIPTLPNYMAFPKVGETNALSNPLTSNSVPSSRESTVVNNERVIAPGIFRINPF